MFMKTDITKGLWTLALLLLAVYGCGQDTPPATTQAPVSTPTATPAVSPTPTHTATPLVVSIAIPIPTPLPASTPPPMPTAASAPSVAWWLPDLFSIRPGGGAASGGDVDVASVEEVLEQGLRLAGASPVHVVFKGTATDDSVRCEWRGIARTPDQREAAVRFWLALDDAEPLQSASQVEAEFILYLTGVSPRYWDYVTASFVPIARGGLSTDLTVLTCYAEYTAAAYLLADLQKSL